MIKLKDLENSFGTMEAPIKEIGFKIRERVKELGNPSKESMTEAE